MVVVHVYLSCVRAGMEVTLEPLESQDQRQHFLIDGEILEWVFLEVGRVVSNWVEGAAQRILL